MAVSTCVRCGKMGFEMKVGEPTGSRYKVLYIQCKSCGGVAGVTDYQNTSVELDGLKKEVHDLAQKVSGVRSAINMLR